VLGHHGGARDQKRVAGRKEKRISPTHCSTRLLSIRSTPRARPELIIAADRKQTPRKRRRTPQISAHSFSSLCLPHRKEMEKRPVHLFSSPLPAQKVTASPSILSLMECVNNFFHLTHIKRAKGSLSFFALRTCHCGNYGIRSSRTCDIIHSRRICSMANDMHVVYETVCGAGILLKSRYHESDDN
jgi:hypothetical protein